MAKEAGGKSKTW